MNGIKLQLDEAGRFTVTSQFEKDLEINEDEKKIAEHFYNLIGEAAPISLERRSSSYLSLCLGGDDFLRFKYTDRAKWIALDSWAVKINDDNPLFISQKNKKQRFWKAELSDLSDALLFDDLVITVIRRS